MNLPKKSITIGIPCFNEEKNVIPMYKKIKSIVNKLISYQFTFIFADNCSTDKTREKINFLAKKDKSVQGIFLSRNFGAEASPFAILNYTQTEVLIIIACDFQDPPEMIPQFIKKWQQGYDIVWGQYIKTDESYFMNLARKTFYRLFKIISNIEVPINATGFGLISRKVINTLKLLPEKYRFGRGLTMWIGFKRAFIPYQRLKRLTGKSSYGFFDYIKQSERGIFGFSYLPLDLMVYTGSIITLTSFILIAVYLFFYVTVGKAFNLTIAIILTIVFFGGVQLLAISIIGKYIQVIVEETKARPVYIVEESINLNPNSKIQISN